jgi:hypothetical protein
MGPEAEGSKDCDVAAYTLRFDRQHGVLLITFGKLATPASALAARGAVEHFPESEETCYLIADLSAVEKAEITGDFVRSLAWTPVVIPAAKQRVIVAPRPELYGLSRMFQLYRDAMATDIQVVRTLEEAEALLGLESPNFEVVH